MKPFYSIRDLANGLKMEIHEIANGLAACGIHAFFNGKEITLSEYDSFSPPIRSNWIQVHVVNGPNSSPEPDAGTVIVISDSLPESWKLNIMKNALDSDQSELESNDPEVSNHLLSQHQMTPEVRHFGATSEYPEQRDAKKNRPPDHFCKALKDLLNSIELKSKAKGKEIDFSAMQGTCANLHDLACKVSNFPKLKLSTFQKYQKKSGLCSFTTHAVNTSFYKELFPELFK